MTTRTLATLGLALLLTSPLAAQSDSAARPRTPPLSPERVLSMRARLGLTNQQITQLNALRTEQLATRQREMSAMLDLRSRLEAGEITRDQVLADQTRRRETVRSNMAQGDRVRGVLTDEQRERLSAMQRNEMRQRVRGAQGNRGMRGAQGTRGARGGRGMGGRGGQRPRGGRGVQRPTGFQGRLGPGAQGVLQPRLDRAPARARPEDRR